MSRHLNMSERNLLSAYKDELENWQGRSTDVDIGGANVDRSLLDMGKRQWQPGRQVRAPQAKALLEGCGGMLAL